MNRLVLILFLIQFSYTQAQEPWVYENSYFEGKQILEAYDGGTLVLANDESFTGPCKLFKLDKTGDVLWEHSFEENGGTTPFMLSEDSEGSIIIAGQTNRFQPNYWNAFILKLNPCGELQWFKNLHRANLFTSVRQLLINKNDDIIFVNYITGSNMGEIEEGTTLNKLNSAGEELWSSILLPDGNSTPDCLIQCTDGGYLVGGDYYAPPYYDQEFNVHYLRAALVKTDSLGNVEWRDIYRWEQDTPDTLYLSLSGQVVEVEKGKYIAHAAKREIPNYRPDLFMLNSEGETVWSKDVSEENTAYDLCKLQIDTNQNILLGTNVAYDPFDYYDQNLEIIKFDTLGNELAKWGNPQRSSLLRDFRWDTDSSSLYVLPGSKVSNSGVWSLYAYKFNPYTMELDTFLTEDDTEYDYLCPEGVVDLNFNFPELNIEIVDIEPTPQLRIAPNPAKNYTYLYFDIENFNRTAKLEIHNLQGQLMSSYPIQGAVGRVHEDLSLYTSGIYVVSLIMDNRLLESRTLVVE